MTNKNYDNNKSKNFFDFLKEIEKQEHLIKVNMILVELDIKTI